jgi:hypothetical protein
MTQSLTWQFAGGESPADSELWLEHQDQLFGFVDIRQEPNGETRRIMTATDVWVRRQLDELRTPSQWSVFAAMIVVPAGSPSAVRAAVDAAVHGGANYFASDQSN